MPTAPPINVTLHVQYPQHADVVLPPPDILIARVRLGAEEEDAIVDFITSFDQPDGTPAGEVIASLVTAFEENADDIYKLLCFLEAGSDAPYHGDTSAIAVCIAAALGAYDRAFPSERP